MKMIRRTLALVLCLALVLGMATTVFAQTVGTEATGTGTITVQNASKGVTYTLVKLFDATVAGDSIAYTGTIPTELADYFQQDTAGNITVTDAGKNGNDLSTAAVDAITAWAKAQKETAASTISDGSILKFVGLDYGYYVVLSTQGGVVSVDSTNPDAVLVDKNTTRPGITKSVNDPDVYIGQTVTYTAEASTANYLKRAQSGEYEIVTHYVIDDTLPDFLTDVTVTSIKVGDQELDVTQFGKVEYEVGGTTYTYENAIVIPWATLNKTTQEYTSLYANGAKIVITYTAKVTDKAEVDGTTGNINVVTLTPYTTPNEPGEPPTPPTPPTPWEETWNAKAVIFTYAAALKKVDENQNPLAGATFQAYGLKVNGEKGNYTVVSYDATSTELGTVMETDDEGHLVILGLPSKVDVAEGETPSTFTLTVVEKEAPAGYNKLEGSFEVPTHVTGVVVTTESGKIWYDENGEITNQESEKHTEVEVVIYPNELKAVAYKVVNQKGVELPSTGGMGTTLFYIMGSALAVAAVILLVTKKRMSSAQ